jgi:hypothetical protein
VLKGLHGVVLADSLDLIDYVVALYASSLETDLELKGQDNIPAQILFFSNIYP